MNPDMFFDDYMPFGGGSLWGAVARTIGQNKAEGVYASKRAEVSTQEYEQAKAELDTALADMLEGAAEGKDISASTVLVESLNMDTTELENKKDRALWDLHGAEDKQTEFFSYLKDMLYDMNNYGRYLSGYNGWEQEEDPNDSVGPTEQMAEVVMEAKESLDNLSETIDKLEAKS